MFHRMLSNGSKKIDIWIIINSIIIDDTIHGAAFIKSSLTKYKFISEDELVL